MSSGIGARLAAMVPPGVLRLGLGTAVLGLASYIHLALAGHVLSPNAKSAVSVLWTLAFSVGYSISMPIEQEMGRIIASEVERGRGTTAVLKRGAVLGAGLLGVVCLLLAVLSPLLAHKLFNGSYGMVAALAGAFAGLVVTAVWRGVLAGHGQFADYGRLMWMDGALRIVLAAVFAAAGVKSAIWFSLILTIAPLTALAAMTPRVRRALTPGGDLPWSAITRGMGLLIGSMLLSQVVLNIAVINVKLLAPAQVTLVSALLAALVLARVPLFVFGALQSALLPGLATAHAAGDTAGFRALVRRSTGIVVVLGLGSALGCVVIGPWSVRTLFGMANEIGVTDFAWLSVGSLFYMQAMVLGQALTAENRHREQLYAWIIGTAALAAVTFGPGGVTTRVELAYAVGSIVTAGAMALILRSRRPVRADLAVSTEAEGQAHGMLAAHTGASGWEHGKS